MNLKGYEQEKPLLKYLRARGLNIPHLDDAYEIWNADANGFLVFAGKSEREKFGYTLYATNLKIQSSSYFLNKVKTLFEPSLVLLEPAMKEDSKFDYYLKRYSYLGAFYWSIFGALDSLASGITVIQNFRKEGKFNPDRCTFEKIKNLLHKIQMGKSKQESSVINRSNLLVDVFKKEQMFSGKNWYAESKKHRHFHTHAPSLYVEALAPSGEKFLPKDAVKSPDQIIDPIRDAKIKGDIALVNKLTKELLMAKPVHILAEELFNNCKRFIGNVYLALRKTYEPEVKKLCQ